jgi:F-type H+-transporting ATPase subunit b
MAAHDRLDACEFMNKPMLRGVPFDAARAISPLARAMAVLAIAMLVTTAASAQQPPVEHPTPGVAAQPADEHAADEHAAEGEHGSIWAGLLWPTLNFAILAGGLWWFFKEPFANYLRDRHSAIRRDLVEAANVKAAAAAQLEELERKLQALPGEIDALRQRGGEEIAAEEARISALAAAERERLLEQTRREIEVQLRLAKRELTEHTADLAVQLAGDRIRQQITPADQDRLVDRYLDQVKGRPS